MIQKVVKKADLRDFSEVKPEQDFAEPDKVVQLGHPPVRVDLMTSISGVSWEQALAHRVAGEYGDISVYFMGREGILKNKRACGRKKDLADLEALGEC